MRLLLILRVHWLDAACSWHEWRRHNDRTRHPGGTPERERWLAAVRAHASAVARLCAFDRGLAGRRPNASITTAARTSPAALCPIDARASAPRPSSRCASHARPSSTPSTTGPQCPYTRRQYVQITRTMARPGRYAA